MTQLATQALQLVADYRAYVGHSGDAEAAPLHERADEMISEWFK
ncbi:hypothetical protein [Vineibacter terrae]|nr:hypothetical protein [Vineibacter terrae]